MGVMLRVMAMLRVRVMLRVVNILRVRARGTIWCYSLTFGDCMVMVQGWYRDCI